MTQDGEHPTLTIGGGQVTYHADGTTEARIWQYDDEILGWLVMIESSLATDWDTPEEDTAWEDL